MRAIAAGLVRDASADMARTRATSSRGDAAGEPEAVSKGSLWVRAIGFEQEDDCAREDCETIERDGGIDLEKRTKLQRLRVGDADEDQRQKSAGKGEPNYARKRHFALSSGRIANYRSLGLVIFGRLLEATMHNWVV